MDSKVTQSNDKLSPKFVWIVVAVTIVLNLIICSLIYISSTKEYVIQFRSGSQVLFEARAASGAVLTDTIERISSTKSGYSFQGWYLDNGTFRNKYDFPDTMPSKNITVYGKWTKEKYTITLDANGGSFAPGATTIFDIEYDEVIVNYIPTLSIPHLSGKVFQGWAKSETSINLLDDDVNKKNNLVPARDITLYAIWADSE